MKIAQLRELIAHLPDDADFVYCEGSPWMSTALYGVFRENAPPALEMIFDGFSAEELRKEVHDVAFFEKENIAAFYIVPESVG